MERKIIKINSEIEIISRTADTPFRYQAWPTVIKDENDVIYVATSSGRSGHVCPFGKNYLFISLDNGKTFLPPTIINNTALDDRDAGLTYLGNGKMMLAFFKHQLQFYLDETEFLKRANRPENWGIIFEEIEKWKTLPEKDLVYGSFTKMSYDYGKTWTEPIKAPISSPHGPSLLSNGKLLWIGKEFHSHEFEKGAIYAFSSTDEGKTWQKEGKIDFPNGTNADNIHEPWQLELPNGEVLGFLRAQGKEVDFGFTIYSTLSKDGAKTWSTPQKLDVNGSPPHAIIHSSGAIVLTFGRRAHPFGLRALISYDYGKTWDLELILDDTAPNDDLGYPSTIELSDGSLYTVYYKRLGDDKFPSIVYAKWNLPKNV